MCSIIWKLGRVNLPRPANFTIQKMEVDPWAKLHQIFMDTRYDRFDFLFSLSHTHTL